MANSLKCNTCEETKPTADFSPRNDCTRGFHYFCKACANISAKKWNAENKGRAAISQRWSNIKKLYGLSRTEYETLYEKQGGGCAICTTEHEVLSVDHNHDTGEVRGLLCSQCNTGIGMFKENDLLMQAAGEYCHR